MRPSRGPYARSQDISSWFTFSSGLLLCLVAAAIVIFFVWPEAFPALVAALMVAAIVNMAAWTVLAGRRGDLQTRQILVNSGLAVSLVLVVVGLVLDLPLWVLLVLILVMGVLVYVGVERDPD
jgi:hypothetical protein